MSAVLRLVDNTGDGGDLPPLQAWLFMRGAGPVSAQCAHLSGHFGGDLMRDVDRGAGQGMSLLVHASTSMATSLAAVSAR